MKRRPPVDGTAPAAGRKAVLYATCFVEYNNPGIGRAAQGVLARNGVETRAVYDACCGMPQLERGDTAEVCRRARRVAAALGQWIGRGWDVIAPIPSCALMMKTTWPQYLPDDPAVARLAAHTRDISEYIVGIARSEGLADGMAPLDGDVALHQACHARAQDIGAKAAVMLRMIPQSNVLMMQRCAGHGGTWGVMRENFDVAMKVGEPVMRQAAEERPRLPRLGMPARGRSHRAGDGALPRQGRAGRARPSPDRAAGDELWHRPLRGCSTPVWRRR